MINFFELEFEIPDGYIFADHKTMDELINSRLGEIDYQFLTMMKETIASGSMAIIYNPIKYDPNLGTAREYINFIATEMPLPNTSNEEYLEQQKKSEKTIFEQAYGTPLEFYKLKISNIPSLSKFSMYSETNGAVEDTYNCQYTFWMSQNLQYVTTLQCFENEKEPSINTFDEIVKSIRLK